MKKNEMEKFALKLAKDSIRHFMECKKIIQIKPEEIPFEELKKTKGCFVTIHLDGEIHGCIGNIEPENKLYEAIIKNAVLAAFYDPRFYPLTTEGEIDNIKIEISILSKPKEIKFRSPEELLKKLKNNKGVILQKGTRKATFLPQVWEQLPKKEEFISELCAKAGLDKDEWKKRTNEIKIKTYTAKIIEEKQTQ